MIVLPGFSDRFGSDLVNVLRQKKFSTAMPTPTIKEAILWVAQLGGYLARRNDPPPGPMALWRGWKRLFDLTDGWNLANAIN